jgi:glycosyltransferase involved in cell wall biosynthesis
VRAISVVVPVADEEEALPACLDALAAARGQLAEQRREVASRIVLVLDRCTDGSEAIARSRDAGGAHLAVVTSLARCVGAARAQGSAEAVAGFGAGADHWIATTDADCHRPRLSLGIPLRGGAPARARRESRRAREHLDPPRRMAAAPNG